jgi:threonyl-tRNA synthetase
MQKKIRRGQLEGYNFLLIVGEQEKSSRSVNVRNRDDPSSQKHGTMVPLDELRAKLKSLRKERRLVNAL